jgi:hydrogenase maturation factor
MSDVDQRCELESTGGRNTSHDHCITCSDEGIPMRVVAVDDDRCLALCEDSAGSRSTVEILLVAPVTAGEELLVHAGTALLKVAA